MSEGKPYRILQVGMSDNYGGTEATVYSIYGEIDRSKLQFDFLNVYGHPIAKQAELEAKGAHVYDLLLKRREGYLKYVQGIKAFYRAHGDEFDAVVCNVQCLDQIDMAKFGRKFGIKKVVLYSHNSGYGIQPSKLARIAIRMNKKNCHRFTDEFFACSGQAASFAFSKKDAAKAHIVNTGIATRLFRFDLAKRAAFRQRYGYGPYDHIYGSAGRFDPQKNQFFLIDIFSAIARCDPQARFFISGRGPLEKELRQRVHDHGLDETCRIVTDFIDYQEFYSGIDCFILPSSFEGLGLVLVEAQCAGLPCLASSGTIPTEACILDNFVYVSLKENSEVWAQKARNALVHGQLTDRTLGFDLLNQAGRDIKTTAHIYEGLFV